MRLPQLIKISFSTNLCVLRMHVCLLFAEDTFLQVQVGVSINLGMGIVISYLQHRHCCVGGV